MARLWSFGGGRLISWAGAVAIMPTFIQRPAVGEGRLLDLLLVTLRAGPLEPVRQRVMRLPLASLPSARIGYVEWAWVTFDAQMLQLLGQRAVLVFGIVARLVLPSIALFALHRPAIVVGVAADATDLAIVLERRAIGRRGGMLWLVVDVRNDGLQREVVTGESRERM